MQFQDRNQVRTHRKSSSDFQMRSNCQLPPSPNYSALTYRQFPIRTKNQLDSPIFINLSARSPSKTNNLCSFSFPHGAFDKFTNLFQMQSAVKNEPHQKTIQSFNASAPNFYSSKTSDQHKRNPSLSLTSYEIQQRRASKDKDRFKKPFVPKVGQKASIDCIRRLIFSHQGPQNVSFLTPTAISLKKNSCQLNLDGSKKDWSISPSKTNIILTQRKQGPASFTKIRNKYKNYNLNSRTAIDATSPVIPLKGSRSQQQQNKKSNLLTEAAEHEITISQSIEKDESFSIQKQQKKVTDVKERDLIMAANCKKQSLNPQKTEESDFKAELPAVSKESQSHSSPLSEVSLEDFIVKKKLGKGRFGDVYLVQHVQTHTVYAMKKIDKAKVKKSELIEQLVKEIRIQSCVSHPNILKIFAHFSDAMHVYLLVQYMEGGTLFELVRRTTKLSEQDSFTYLKQIAKGVEHLHSNEICHRDLKPENIVISHGVCKICDFGWAALCDQRRKTFCGTCDYISPEVIAGDSYDKSVDLWSLGVLTYELLIGRPPFFHQSMKQTMQNIKKANTDEVKFPPQISSKARNFIQSLLKKDPTERLTIKEALGSPFLTVSPSMIPGRKILGQ